jgi:hypothetical protein
MHSCWFSRTTGPILTRLGTNHPLVKGIQVCSNEGDCLSPWGDNSKTIKIHWKFLKIVLGDHFVELNIRDVLEETHVWAGDHHTLSYTTTSCRSQGSSQVTAHRQRRVLTCTLPCEITKTQRDIGSCLSCNSVKARSFVLSGLPTKEVWHA